MSMLYNCPFCYHQRATIYLKNQDLGNGGQGDIYSCNECGSLYPSPRMDESAALKHNFGLVTNQMPVDFYSHYYDDAKEHIRHDHFFKSLLKKWMKFEGNTLDIGAFIGRFCKFIETLGFNAYGLEPQENAAQFAKANGMKVYAGLFPEKIPADLRRIKFKLISMMESIYYITDLKKGLLTVNEMLEKGGFFLIQCHQGRSVYYSKTGSSLFKRYGDYVQAIPTLYSLRYCLEKTGFEIVYVSSLPIDFIQLLYKGSLSNDIFSTVNMILNKLYGLIRSNIEVADKLIILARKCEVKDV